MKFVSRTAILAAFLLSAACRVSDQTQTTQPAAEKAAIAPILSTADARDVHSFARPLEARVHHIALDLDVNFDTRRIGGTATLDIDRLPDAKEIILDDNSLEIHAVTDGSGKPLAWKVGRQGR